MCCANARKLYCCSRVSLASGSGVSLKGGFLCHAFYGVNVFLLLFKLFPWHPGPYKLFMLRGKIYDVKWRWHSLLVVEPGAIDHSGAHGCQQLPPQVCLDGVNTRLDSTADWQSLMIGFVRHERQGSPKMNDSKWRSFSCLDVVLGGGG